MGNFKTHQGKHRQLNDTSWGTLANLQHVKGNMGYLKTHQGEYGQLNDTPWGTMTT